MNATAASYVAAYLVLSVFNTFVYLWHWNDDDTQENLTTAGLVGIAWPVTGVFYLWLIAFCWGFCFLASVLCYSVGRLAFWLFYAKRRRPAFPDASIEAAMKPRPLSAVISFLVRL